MISANSIDVRFGKRVLFEGVSIEFKPGNCYGIIGANGSGKSTFLKVLAGEHEPDGGSVSYSQKLRLSVLKQDQFEFDEFSVLDTVVMGNKPLYDIKRERELLYEKTDMSDQDGIRLGKLESDFAEMNGWNMESDAALLLQGLGVPDELHAQPMKNLDAGLKVRVLLAQALFGNPDILILDEPTNHLDHASIAWLEEFLDAFENTVILVSHDRHFLDAVCTHTCDIDYGKIQLYSGNYSFWYGASNLMLQQRQALKEKNDAKIKELQDFIARFSANAARSRQATSRRKQIENLRVEDIKPSSRRSPSILFKSQRQAGKDILKMEGLSKSLDGRPLFRDLSAVINRGEKVAIVGPNGLAATALFDILMGDAKADSGAFLWGTTTSQSYFPKENGKYFESDKNLIEWLINYVKGQEDQATRSLLGRMLFSGEETLKPLKVLSGGERVRCMLARLMAAEANVLLFDEPTNHLDLEAIEALNEAVTRFDGTVLLSSRDRRFLEASATRVIELLPNGIIDETMGYEEYLKSPRVAEQREILRKGPRPMGWAPSKSNGAPAAAKAEEAGEEPKRGKKEKGPPTKRQNRSPF